jgi:hypothetical protein
MFKVGHNRPIFLRFERLDFTLAVDNHPQRDGLNPPRRFRAWQLAPQHRRQRKSDQIIQGPPCAISVDQVIIERARGCHRLKHRGLGNGVEGHALDVLGQRLLFCQHFADMP